MEDAPVNRFTSVIVATFLILVSCQLAQAVIEPVLFAAFVVELTWPLHKFLQKKVGSVALILTAAITSAVIAAFFSIIVWSGKEIADWVRHNLEQIQTVVVSSTAWLEQHDIFVLALVSDHVNAASLLRLLHAVVVRVNTLLAFALLVLLYVLMGLAETDSLRLKVAGLKNEETARRLLAAGRRTGEKFRTYMLVRSVASLLTGFSISSFILFMGLELSGAWGVLAFALNYLPYVGSLAITVLVPIFAFVQTGSPEMAVTVLVAVMAIQFMIGSYLEPVFSGSALSISPAVVLFAVVLWTFLWGAPGAFLGVPLTIAMLTTLEQFPETRWLAEALSGNRPIGPAQAKRTLMSPAP